MDTLILTFGPAFAVAFGVQRVVEIATALMATQELSDTVKKAVNASLALILAIVVVSGVEQIRVLGPLGISDAGVWDWLATVLIISAGTEGFNSILKFLGYTKEKKKAEAATALSVAETTAEPQLEMLQMGV